MKNLPKTVKCKNFMVIQAMLQLVKLLKPQKKTMEIIEKTEKLIIYNPTLWLMLMKMLEMIENMTGKMLEVSKLLAVIGVHKSIFQKQQTKVVLILINKNKII